MVHKKIASFPVGCQESNDSIGIFCVEKPLTFTPLALDQAIFCSHFSTNLTGCFEWWMVAAKEHPIPPAPTIVIGGISFVPGWNKLPIGLRALRPIPFHNL